MILTARVVAPMDRPAITDGAVRIEGTRIVEVGSRRDLVGGAVTDLGDVVLLPGFINAHSHLELSAYAGRIKPSGLWMWLARLMRSRRGADPVQEQAAAIRAAEDSLRCGVTCIADISRQGDVWRVLRGVPIRKVCFAELISLAGEPPRNPDELADAVDAVACDDRLAAGISPHAPYTVRAEHIAACAEFALRRGLPVTTHWAETREECRWIARGGGILGAMIRGLGGAGVIASPRCSPIEYARRLGLLSAGALLAHVNYITDDDLDRLALGRAFVVFCPRSHAFFGHKGHRWRDMITAGVDVCIGTDSAASLPAGSRLSILDEIRFLRRRYSDVPAEQLLSMATIVAARALKMDDCLGSLTPGKEADLVAVPIDLSKTRDGNLAPLKGDPLDDILAHDQSPVGVWVAGERYT